jgi:transposase
MNSGAKALLAERRAKAARLVLEGWTFKAIAAELGIAVSTVTRDMKVAREEWLDRACEAVEQHRSVMLQRLELIQREAWKEWHRSKEQAKKTKAAQTTSAKEGVKTTAEQQTEEQCGDPRYLEQIRQAIMAQARLLGAEAALKMQFDGLPEVMEIEISSREQNERFDEFAQSNGLKLIGAG